MKQSIYLIALLFFASCGNQFLGVKPTQRQQVPATLEDFLGMMDYSYMMNETSSHYLGFIGGDELELTENQYNTFPVGIAYDYQKNAYTWNKAVYEGGESDLIDWTRGYKRILYANIVLEGLGDLDLTAEKLQMRDLVKGMALFHRALNFFNLAQLYCGVYRKETAQTEMGLPLRLTGDVTEVVPRANLQETYDRILKDLHESAGLLPDFGANSYRPSKWAAFALLSRIYLQLDDFDSAHEFASACIALNGELLDFNLVDTLSNSPFNAYGANHPEVILMTTMGSSASYFRMVRLAFNASSELLSLYAAGDLRKPVYFEKSAAGIVGFKGSYDGIKNFVFTGLAIDEVYLNRAESAARTGNLQSALADLNQLRRHRYVKAGYEDLASNDRLEILDWIIEERRKELVARGIRWGDLRRLNKEPRYERVLTRVIGSTRYELPANDLRWVWPLPVEAVRVGQYTDNAR